MIIQPATRVPIAVPMGRDIVYVFVTTLKAITCGAVNLAKFNSNSLNEQSTWVLCLKLCWESS